MNLAQPPKWRILFTDGTTWSTEEGTWSVVSSPVVLDGFFVYETSDLVTSVSLLTEDGLLLDTLLPPTPRPCFAHKRMTTLLGSHDLQWLYTCFGYSTDEVRVTITVSPSGIIHGNEPRSMPFIP